MEVCISLWLLLSVKLRKWNFSFQHCAWFLSIHCCCLPASNLAVRNIYGFVLCLCFPNRLRCNFQRKGRSMCFCFALVGEGHNKYQQSKQIMRNSLASCMNDEIMGLQLFPDDRILRQASRQAPWGRAHPIPVLSFLAVCSPVCLGVHWKVNFNGLSNILISNLVANENQKNSEE